MGLVIWTEATRRCGCRGTAGRTAMDVAVYLGRMAIVGVNRIQVTGTLGAGELAGGWRAHARALWASCNQHARNARAKAHEDRFVGLGSAPGPDMLQIGGVLWKCRVPPRLVSHLR